MDGGRCAYLVDDAAALEHALGPQDHDVHLQHHHRQESVSLGLSADSPRLHRHRATEHAL